VLAYYDWTWEASSAPKGATAGVAFNGWADPAKALQDSENVFANLVGDKWISIGGGNSNGRFTAVSLKALIASINAGNMGKYVGLVLDVEECDSGLSSLFKDALAAAKAKGMLTMVTISHSAPYGCTDAPTLMFTFFSDDNTDYLSPQMYTRGTEHSPELTETRPGLLFDAYVLSKPAIVPSIVDGSHYAAVSDFFGAKGVTLSGYVQWAHASSWSQIEV